MDLLQNYVKTTMERSPQNTVGTVTTTYRPLSEFGRVRFDLLLGDMPSSIVLNAAVYEATDSSGTGAQAISGAAISALSDDDDNEHVSIDVLAEKLTINSGYDHVALRVTATGTAVAAILRHDYHPRHGAVTQPTGTYTEAVAVY